MIATPTGLASTFIVPAVCCEEVFRTVTVLAPPPPGLEPLYHMQVSYGREGYLKRVNPNWIVPSTVCVFALITVTGRHAPGSIVCVNPLPSGSL